MNEDNRKVNSGTPETQSRSTKALDEITDGFFDLSKLYSTAPSKKPSAQPKPQLSREEQLRLRDQKCRELEMQAIREDIERRYSIQLEEAKKNTEQSVVNTEPEPAPEPIIDFKIGEEVSVKEEIERIDEIMGIAPQKEEQEDAPKKKKKKFGKVKKEKPEKIRKTEKADKTAKEETPAEEFSTDDMNFLYAFIYQLGDFITKSVAAVFKFIFMIFRIPLFAILRYFNKSTNSTKNRLKKSVVSTVNELVLFRREIKSAVRSIHKSAKKPLTLPSVIKHYVSKAIKHHKKLLKTFFNHALPVATAIILIITVTYWNNATFALEVIYNGKSIGYISDEAVYLEAKDIVKQRLVTGGISVSETTEGATEQTVAPDLHADYKLTVISVDQLNDAQAISDNMIENSVDNLTHACGIYVDGEFICAVKNESDAKSVFHNILAPYEQIAETEGYVVSFAQTIDYVQGLYRDDAAVMWDVSKLNEVVGGNKSEAVMYTVEEGDTIESIAENNDVTQSSLEKANPDYDWDTMEQGDVITLKAAVKFVNIKRTVTSTEVRDVPFETVEKRDETKYSGYRLVEQSGENGVERVTKTMIYVDGELVDTQYSYETIVESIDEIVVVGTKTYYDGVYIGSPSDSGFLWPAPSCHYVSSPYGWRSSGWHNGVDLVRSGGGANGTPVVASMGGTVEVVQRSNSGYGNMVLINHGNGYKTRYAHMISGSITVSVGDRVEAGQTIGRVGSTGNSTGPHLHFEVIYKGETQNPMNYIS